MKKQGKGWKWCASVFCPPAPARALGTKCLRKEIWGNCGAVGTRGILAYLGGGYGLIQYCGVSQPPPQVPLIHQNIAINTRSSLPVFTPEPSVLLVLIATFCCIGGDDPWRGLWASPTLQDALLTPSKKLKCPWAIPLKGDRGTERVPVGRQVWQTLTACFSGPHPPLHLDCS